MLPAAAVPDNGCTSCPRSFWFYGATAGKQQSSYTVVVAKVVPLLYLISSDCFEREYGTSASLGKQVCTDMGVDATTLDGSI